LRARVIQQTELVNLIFLLPTLGYGMYLYATTGSPILLILSGLTVTVWLLFSNQKRFDLDAEVSLREGRVWLGDKRLGVFPWLWSAPVRNVVYPALFPQPKTEIDFPSLPSWAWGMTVTGEVLASPICRTSPHSLVIGQTGAGKTQLLVRAIQAFQHEVIVLDLKGGDDYVNLAGSFTIYGPGQLEEALAHIALRLQASGTPTLFVVDELAEALRNPKLAVAIESLCAKGRSFGAHFLGASQTMTGISRAIWTNCQNRVAIRADSIDRVQLGLPAKPLNAEIAGYAELSTPVLTGFYFPETLRAEPQQLSNPLMAREATRPLLAPHEGSAQFRRTPWDQ
jgi:hypothetical protein